jgi:protein-tyrosine-phosphatase
MAETLMDDAVDRSSGLHGNVKTRSAGTFACEDAEATSEAMRAMEEFGLSLRKHEAGQFSPELADWADLIFAMGKEQIEHMEVIAPEEAHKMHTLLGYINGVPGDPAEHDKYDISDPFGGDMDDYRSCAAQLRDTVERLAELLERQRMNANI